MRVWLDDFREEPPGWERTYWPDEAIDLLATGRVEIISLDHDLGDDERGTGYDVLRWIEEQVYTNPRFILPMVKIHSANPAASEKMYRALKHIERRYKDPNYRI